MNTPETKVVIITGGSSGIDAATTKLFLNSGIGRTKAIGEVSEKLFDKVIAINYKGVYFTVQRSLRYLNQNASIILMAAAAAHSGFQMSSVYASSKAAVKHLAKCLAAELASTETRVNSISPGFVETPIWDNLKQVKHNAIETLAIEVPLNQRVATASEIADVANFLASSNSCYITGEDILVDGGILAKALDIL